jgi:hypothetical protein
MQFHEIPNLRNPVALFAFTGWNDAGEAATGALSHLLGIWAETSTLIAEIDPEEYFDFQVNRPHVYIDDSKIRRLTWPTVKVWGITTPSLPFDLVIINGTEPSMRWTSFATEIIDVLDDLEVDLAITLGSLLADTPHSRPIPVTGTGTHPELAKKLGVEVSRYEGPTGILGVLQDALNRRELDAISMWAAIPHYASGTPSPKASLALLNAVEDFLEISLPQGDLPDAALAWEIAIGDLAKDDVEISEYVKQLEESKDAAEIPAATPESIAKEFERYLRHQEEN